MTDERPKKLGGLLRSDSLPGMMNLEIEELRFKKLLRSIKDVCDLADFEIEGRVRFDRQTVRTSMEVASPNRVNLPRFCLI